MATTISTSRRVPGHTVVRRLLTGVMLGLGAYHLITGYVGQPQAQMHRGFHVTVMLALSFGLALSKPAADRNKTPLAYVMTWMHWALFAGVIWAGMYILSDVNAFAQRVGQPNVIDVIAGTILIVAVLESGRRHLGWAITIVAGLFLLYPLVASSMPGSLRGASSSWRAVVDVLVVQNHGIFGVSVGAMADYIVHFMLFAALLQVSGAEQFFIDLARATVGKRPGGVAKVAVVGSGLLGTISGAAMANVASTGAFTIPMMRRAGYRPEFAGGVEAVASSGGQLVPPIMGVAAFLMADILAVPYVDVLKAAVVPALLFYLALYAMVHLEGRRIETRLPAAVTEPVGSDTEAPSAVSVLLRGWPYLVPIFAIVFFLFRGFSVTRSALWGVLLMAALCFTQSRYRQRPALVLEGIATGIRQAIPVSVATAVVGIIIGGVTLGDLGRRLGLLVRDVAGSELLFALVLLAAVSVVLGMAMPTVAVYITLAVTVVPAIVEMGVAPMPAHMFAFYFGIIANITPPVAVAAFVAAGIAGSDPMKTGLEAFRLGLVAFLVPFAFVYHPVLISPALSLEFLMSLLTATIASIVLGVALIGWLGRDLPWYVRVVAAAGSVGMLIPGWVTDLVGLGLIVVAGSLTLLRRQQAPAPQRPTTTALPTVEGE